MVANKQSKVSMVVPCYNKEAYIGDMLRSVHEQVWDNIELILVNDGSTDGTREVIAQWEPKLRERGFDVVIIDQENQGCCAAVYAGLIKMTGDYFCLVDCDDEIMPEYVSRMAGWLDEHDDYEWAACSYQRCMEANGERVMQPITPTKANQDTEQMLENYIVRRIITMVWIYMTRVSYIKHCKMIENFNTQRNATYEPLIAVPLMSGGGKLKFFKEPLYIFNNFASDLYRFDSYEKMAAYYDDYLYLYKWAIDKLPVSEAERDKLRKLAQLIYYSRQLMYVTNTASDGERYKQTQLNQLLEFITELFDYPVRLTPELVEQFGYWEFIKMFEERLMASNRLRKVIGYGVLGQRGERLLPAFDDLYIRPSVFWDQSADGTQEINGITVTQPEFEDLSEDDIIIIFPKNPEINEFVHKESRGALIISTVQLWKYQETFSNHYELYWLCRTVHARFVIFETGRVGKGLYKMHRNKYNIICFADNDPAKQGTEYLSLDVINPNEIAPKRLKVIIATRLRYHLDTVEQLLDLGIKDFYFPVGKELKHIDLPKYNDLTIKPNKVCVLGANGTGTFSKALAKHNPFHDLEVVSIRFARIDADFYYHYLTSALVISHVAEPISNKKTIELWHGFPIKTVFFMVEEEINKNLAIEYKQAFEQRDAICSLSKLYSIFYGYCANIEYDKFIITGYPRNDMLFKSDGKKVLESLIGKVRQKYVVFYMPTYREGYKVKMGDNENSLIFDMNDFDKEDFVQFLRENDILLVCKMHSMQEKYELLCDGMNIVEIPEALLTYTEIDIYEIINAADCLISDYSSIIIDYLLLDRPIILTPLDLEAYSKSPGLMMEPYDAWMPGEIALDYESLKTAISNALFGEDIYKKDREWLRKITHHYNDGNSTERVLALARNILGIGE